MARYIDADKLKPTLKNLPQWGGEVLLMSVLTALDMTPTADVVPKIEVERLNKEFDVLAEEHSDLIVEKDELFDIAEKLNIELEAMRTAANSYKMHYESLKNENIETIKAIADDRRAYAREIFEEIDEKILCSISVDSYINAPRTTHERIWNELTELKKKYTEEL